MNLDTDDQIQNFNNGENFDFESLEQQPECFNYMHWFPSVWDLGSEEVIQRQLEDAREEESLSKSLFEIGSRPLLGSASLAKFNSIPQHEGDEELLIANNSNSEDGVKQNGLQTHFDSGKTTSFKLNRDEEDAQKAFDDKENHLESSEEENKDHKLGNVSHEVDFQSRARFTKRHDRGKAPTEFSSHLASLILNYTKSKKLIIIEFL